MTDDQGFRFYGIKETNTAASEVDRHIEEISVSGFTVVPGVIEEAELPEDELLEDEGEVLPSAGLPPLDAADPRFQPQVWRTDRELAIIAPR